MHVALSSDFSNFFLFLYLLFFLLDLYFHSAETFVRKNFLSVYFEFETIKQGSFSLPVSACSCGFPERKIKNTKRRKELCNFPETQRYSSGHLSHISL